MNLLDVLKKYEYLVIGAAIFLFVIFFGTVEVAKGLPVDAITSALALVLVALVSYRWVRAKRYEWFVYLYVLLQPMTLFPIKLFGSVRLSFVMLPLACVALYFMIRERKLSLRFGRLAFPLILLLGCIALSTAINITSGIGLSRFVLFVSNVVFVFVVLNMFRTKEAIEKLLIFWTASVSFLMVFGIGVSIFAHITGDSTSPFIQGSIDGIIRISSLTPDSNYFAALLILPLCYVLTKILNKHEKLTPKTFWLHAGVAIMATTTMLITYSRAGLVALVVVFAAFLFYQRQFTSYRFYSKIALIIVSAIALSTLIQPEFFRNMVLRMPDVLFQSETSKLELAKTLDFDKSDFIFRGRGAGLFGFGDQVKPDIDSSFERNISDEAIDVRGLYWDVAYKMIDDRPVLGLGAGGYPKNFEKYLGYSYWTKFPNTHNIYLESLAEFGVVGLLALIFLVVRSISLLRSLHRFSDPSQRTLIFALGVGLFASLIQFFFQPGFNIMNLWLIFGLLACVEFLPRKPKSSV